MGNSAGILCYYLWPPYVIYALLSLNTLKKRIQKATNYEQLNYAKIEFQKAKSNLSLIFILCIIFQFAGGAIVNYSVEWNITWGPCAALGAALPFMVCAYGDKRIKQCEQKLKLLEQIAIDFEEEKTLFYYVLTKHEIIGEFEEKVHHSIIVMHDIFQLILSSYRGQATVL